LIVRIGQAESFRIRILQVHRIAGRSTTSLIRLLEFYERDLWAERRFVYGIESQLPSSRHLADVPPGPLPSAHSPLPTRPFTAMDQTTSHVDRRTTGPGANPASYHEAKTAAHTEPVSFQKQNRRQWPQCSKSTGPIFPMDATLSASNAVRRAGLPLEFRTNFTEQSQFRSNGPSIEFFMSCSTLVRALRPIRSGRTSPLLAGQRKHRVILRNEAILPQAQETKTHLSAVIIVFFGTKLISRLRGLRISTTIGARVNRRQSRLISISGERQVAEERQLHAYSRAFQFSSARFVYSGAGLHRRHKHNGSAGSVA